MLLTVELSKIRGLLLCSAMLFFSKAAIGVNLLRRRPRRFSLASSSLYSLFLDIPVQLREISDIASRYDIFLFDQFGVLHDGSKPLPGAVQTLEYLNSLGKTVIILSNTSSRRRKAIDRLEKIGISEVLYSGGVVTSGENAYNFISDRSDLRRCCWFTWKNKHSCEDPFVAGLDLEIRNVSEADFLLFQGTEVLVTGPAPCDATELNLCRSGVIEKATRDVLVAAAERGIPAVCANMDYTAVTQDGIAYMPGLLMREYSALGGECISFGKPIEQYFRAAISQAERLHRQNRGISPSQKLRSIHVGDSIEHDIRGAAEARIDSILLTDHGIHQEQLNSSYDKIASPSSLHVATSATASCSDVPLGENPPLLIRVCNLCDELQSPRPTFILPSLQSGGYLSR